MNFSEILSKITSFNLSPADYIGVFLNYLLKIKSLSKLGLFILPFQDLKSYKFRIVF